MTTSIGDLKEGMKKVDVIGMVRKIDKRTVNLKVGGTAEVADIAFQDVSGEIKLSLWDGQIELAEIGKKLKINNGYVNGWNGIPQLNVGKFGSIEEA